MEFVCYFIYYQTGNVSFAYSSFYAIVGGVLLGWAAIITGAIDLMMIKDEGSAQAKAFIHGLINSTVVLIYTILAFIAYSKYPNLSAATVTILIVKASANLLMVVGNYLGGDLVLKYKIGVQRT